MPQSQGLEPPVLPSELLEGSLDSSHPWGVESWDLNSSSSTSSEKSISVSVEFSSDSVGLSGVSVSITVSVSSGSSQLATGRTSVWSSWPSRPPDSPRDGSEMREIRPSDLVAELELEPSISSEGSPGPSSGSVVASEETLEPSSESSGSSSVIPQKFSPEPVVLAPESVSLPEISIQISSGLGSESSPLLLQILDGWAVVVTISVAISSLIVSFRSTVVRRSSVSIQMKVSSPVSLVGAVLPQMAVVLIPILSIGSVVLPGSGSVLPEPP